MTETAGRAWKSTGLEDIEDRVPIMTGAAGGIGREIVRGLLGGGAKSAEPHRA